MLITQANGFVSQIHDRMPVILEPEQFERGLPARLVPKFSSRGQRSAATMAGFEAGEYPDRRSGRAENNEDGNYVCAIAT
jgi:putative SOS response-associated peptidase YedK